MPWFRRKYSEQELASVVSQAVAQAVEQVSKKLEGNQNEQMTKLVDSLFGKLMDASAKQLDGFGKLSEGIQGLMSGALDLSLRRTASLWGQRGGKASAAAREKKKVAQQLHFDCPVCANPNSAAGRESQAIVRHVQEQHEARLAAAARAAQPQLPMVRQAAPAQPPQETEQQRAIREHQEYVRSQSGQAQRPEGMVN